MRGSTRRAHVKQQKHTQIYGIAGVFSCIYWSETFKAIWNVLSYKIMREMYVYVAYGGCGLVSIDGSTRQSEIGSRVKKNNGQGLNEQKSMLYVKSQNRVSWRRNQYWRRKTSGKLRVCVRGMIWSRKMHTRCDETESKALCNEILR
jgi:hypothetical protein